MKPIFMLIYTSHATLEVTREVLHDLVTTSQTRNMRDDITGFLVARTGYFLQLLEGEETKVRALYQDIIGDTRHHAIILQGETYADTRIMPGWRMGLVDEKTVDETQSILSLLELGRRGQIYSDRTSLETILRIFAKDAKPVAV